MATEMITLKLDREFLRDIDEMVKHRHYHNRTEFIREALREKLTAEEKEYMLAHLKKIRGSAKKKVTKEEYERVRKTAADDLARERGWIK
ncbi:ribbon-helix-helix protein, CopG family [Candidatus Woesearchaeota archaeon]|nr:ribbon-helix-helix protein, CopG family [Candidatus Woesearchaeota archaeon]